MKLANLKKICSFYSTGSSALNAMSLVVLEDIIKKRVRDLTDADAAKICKIIGKLLNTYIPELSISDN